MPRVKSFAPSWLNQPAPGHKLFAPTNDENVPNSVAFGKNAPSGRRQTIAKRGTEVFVAVGKQIRWGDLVYLKESWESKQGAGTRMPSSGSHSLFGGSYNEEAGGSEPLADAYRTIKTPVADEIRQLVMSPQQDYLAVLTKHTVHICILPDSSHLTTSDTEPFKAKFWTLGPTTHVTSRSAIASAVWHPLGVGGSALVTVTEDAVVRVWELSMANRWSFDTPTFSIDLKKLADGTVLEQDFSASTTVNQGFSPDSFDMEVAAACFPGRGSGRWSSMTLWVAMTGGDVYALCPLLPHRWAPPPTLIPSLSVSIVAKMAAIEDDAAVSPQAKLLAQQQLEWMADLDAQEPRVVESVPGEPMAEVYQRPSRPGIVPRLQGPFLIEFNPDDEQDDEVELRDIFVVGEKISTTDLMMGEDEDVDLYDDEQGLSLSVICLLSASGQVKICLDLDGVEAQWLPSKSKGNNERFALADEQPSLLAFQTFDTMKPAELRPDGWPMFTEDITSRYAFYVTHTAGITHVSLAPWVFRLENELPGDSEAGAAFRLDLLVKGQGSDRERIYTQRPEQGVLAAAVAMRDPDLGYFALSATQHDPVALFFETAEEELLPLRAGSDSPESHRAQSLEAPQPLEIWEPRPLFHPAEIFDTETGLRAWLHHLKTGKRHPLLLQEVRLSVATLEMFTEGHRLVSSEIFFLNQAVAELFRKGESLQAELREQIVRANEIKHRVECITGDDTGVESESDDIRLRRRIQAARKSQEDLTGRVEALKKKLGRTVTRELSDKEKAWTEEVRLLEQTILGDSDENDAGAAAASLPRAATSKAYWQRASEAQSLWNALSTEGQKLQRRASVAAASGDGNSQERPTSPASPSRGLRMPAELRKAKLAQVKGMLERETALVEAVKMRLERLVIT